MQFFFHKNCGKKVIKSKLKIKNPQFLWIFAIIILERRNNMKIGIASDHRGYKLKEFLKNVI